MTDLSEKKLLLKIIFIAFTSSILINIVLMGIAIAYYPGGNFMDNSHEGFSFLWNTMCDLGSNPAVNGKPSIISNAIYRTAATLLSISTGIFLGVLWIFFQEKKQTKIRSLIGSGLGILQAGVFLGVSYTGGDLHIALLIVAPLLQFFAILIFAITFIIDKRFPKISIYSFIGMFILALIYMTLVIVTTPIGGDIMFLIRHAGHTSFEFVVFLGYAIQGIGAYQFINRQELKSE
ncbi:MAG: hypothetical protein ACXABK_07465 [Candidatus Heimdallarchaeaceae archaeon]|jgi:hypothetical protein